MLIALLVGAGVYYFQEYHYYEDATPVSGAAVELTSLVSGTPEQILAEDVQAIDANSSPIRYRACFTTSMSDALLSETYVAYDAAEPRNAPVWFECFDAAQIGEDLENGQALPFLGTENITYGIDRVVAVYPDGRGYVWHQINRCGAAKFDGKDLPDGCPPPPASTPTKD